MARQLARVEALDTERPYTIQKVNYVLSTEAPVHGTVVKLRPLHRLDLSGSLAIIIDEYYVEFRMNERWDAGLQRPVVLIHYFEDNISYLMGHVDLPVRFGDADPDWSLYGDILIRNGDNFEIKEGEGTAFYYHLKIELQNIDVEKRTASISIDYSGVPSIHPEPLYIWPWEYRSPAIPHTLGSAQDIVIINQKSFALPIGPFDRSSNH